jgi:Plasmid pRiA4b ORF-3-like protein
MRTTSPSAPEIPGLLANVARLKITLDRVKPQVLRRVEVPLDLRLDRLHLVIQAAMGWENCHLYEFQAGNQRWGIPDKELGWGLGDGPHNAKRATLAELLGPARGKFKYWYDFGDDWFHTITLENLVPAEPAAVYPRLIAAKRRCPPEDVGGPWGYADYLEAIADPTHERHDELIDWRGPGFDPNDPDEAGIRKRLDRLAARFYKPKPRPARPRGKTGAALDR